MTQKEFLEFINKYNSVDRKLIKGNLKRIMKEKDFKLKDIIELGYNKHNAAAWINPAAPNIPMHWQALHVSTAYNFDVREFLQGA